jgi:hypothetical protein
MYLSTLELLDIDTATVRVMSSTPGVQQTAVAYDWTVKHKADHYLLCYTKMPINDTQKFCLHRVNFQTSVVALMFRTSPP